MFSMCEEPSCVPSNPDNLFANLTAKTINPLDSAIHSFSLPRLLSDPTPCPNMGQIVLLESQHKRVGFPTLGQMTGDCVEILE